VKIDDKERDLAKKRSVIRNTKRKKCEKNRTSKQKLGGILPPIGAALLWPQDLVVRLWQLPTLDPCISSSQSNTKESY
jgi:hypothetical protein